MSEYQPPLLNGTGRDIPSPLFTPRPGWGGQLREWFSENAYLITFRAIIGAAALLVLVSIIRNRPGPTTALPSPSEAPLAVDGYRVMAQPGEGYSHLAAHALDDRLAGPPPQHLTAAEHLFAVDTLWRQARALSSDTVLRAGASSFFASTALDNAISAARALTPAQRAAWSRLLRK